MDLPRLAIRNVLRNRMRTLLSVSAIALGVAGLIVIGGFVDDLFRQLAEATVHSQLGHLQIYRKGFFEFGAQQPARFLIESSAEVDAALQRTPGVSDVLHRLNFSALLNSRHGDRAVVGEGGEPEKESRLGSYVTFVQGRQLTDRDRFGMVVGRGVARSLGLRPGDVVNLVVSAEGGAMNTLEFEVVGVFRTYSKEFDDRAVRIALPAAQELMNTRSINAAVVTLSDTGATDTAAAAVASLLPRNKYEVKTWHQLSDFYDKTVGLFQREFLIINVIVLAMVLLSAVNAINLTNFERTAEFGTLLALGARGQSLVRLLMLEAVLLGLAGAVLGVLLGLLAALVLSAIGIPMPPPPNADVGYTALIRIVPAVIGGAFLVGFGAVIIAGFGPALRASRLDIAEALRQRN